MRRLDRLISDISDASRLDAELAREDAGRSTSASCSTTVVGIDRATPRRRGGPKFELDIQLPPRPSAYFVLGHDCRLGQVINNLIDNARSFSPQGRHRPRRLRADAGGEVEIVVDDDGPGIRADQFERIFERFYTDRPEQEASARIPASACRSRKQIVEAHGGTIGAENRTRPATEPGEPPVCSARASSCGCRPNEP